MYSKYPEHIAYILYIYYKLKWKPFLEAWFLVNRAYKVSKNGYGRTKLDVTMYTKYTAHVSSNGSHFLTAGFFVYIKVQ